MYRLFRYIKDTEITNISDEVDNKEIYKTKRVLALIVSKNKNKLKYKLTPNVLGAFFKHLHSNNNYVIEVCGYNKKYQFKEIDRIIKGKYIAICEMNRVMYIKYVDTNNDDIYIWHKNIYGMPLNKLKEVTYQFMEEGGKL